MIELYLWDRCPFCQKVLNSVQQTKLVEGVDYIVIDGSPDTPGRENVIKRGGKSMVPFLIDGDHVMYESNDIVAYLNEK